ncbi:hypothetical protein AVEN_77399-1 [Araneus ventricosus]|uniref:CCHC-type domain-containing protein n=1 Tax=Araneus ventricosus TaxID=182803 RepID=A0A4Y2C851_ARAVE|nr:hypothetical protein AVEN_77399-1 [Araneus ventricosus]
MSTANVFIRTLPTWENSTRGIGPRQCWLTTVGCSSEMLPSSITRDRPKEIEKWNQPLELLETLDAYENISHGLKKNSTPHNKQNFRIDFPTTERRFKSTVTPKEDNHKKTARNVLSKKTDSTPERRTLQCYGCGTLGYTQSKCPTCSKSKGEAKASVNCVNLFTFKETTSPSSFIVLKICGVESAVCADTGASHSIAGEKLFHMLQSKKVKFKPKIIYLTLADGTQSNVAALTTVVDLKVEGKAVATELSDLPEPKGNRTLLGTNFLQSAGIVLDVLNGKWHFCENPQIQYPFYNVPSKNEISTSISDSEKRIQKLPVLFKFLKRHLL